MTNKTTNFEGTVVSPQSSYLWSNAANWTNGVPVSGDSVIMEIDDPSVVDDIAGLSLANLTEASTLTVRADLTVSQDITSIYCAIIVQAGATVTIGTITDHFGSPGNYTAEGTGSTFVDQSATDQGEAFAAEEGGKIEIFAVPASSSIFNYHEVTVNNMLVGGGTIAFKSLAATNAMLLSGIEPGDVLELPGASVSGVTFGTSSLSVTTSAGTYAFTNVTYAAATEGYTAAVDPVTGLVAITFNDTNRFQQDVAAASGALAGDYLWSNAANWTAGVPANGSAFTVDADGYDDIAALRLVDLTLDKTGAEPEIFVTGGTLAIADLLETGSAGSALLEADATDAGAPVSVTLDQNDSHGVLFEANGAGARFYDQTTAGAIAGSYVADHGGLVELQNTPLTGDIFSYGTLGVFAFKAPAAENLALITNLAGGDVLELPGTSVSNVSFGTDSLSVTTDTGTYDFGSVVYATPIIRYTAAYDSSTGLEAVTLRGVDTFDLKQAAASGPDSGYALWSIAANWSEGLPINGDSVNVDASLGVLSIDDLAALTLPTLTLSDFDGSHGTLHADPYVTGEDLTIGSLTAASGTALTADSDFLTSDSDSLSNPVAVTIGSVTGGVGQIFTARGSETTFLDQSVTDPGAIYRVVYGGFMELAATPSSASSFQYVAGGTYAFANPGATNTAALTGVSPGEVLELPGTSVSAVIFGTHSLTVTSDTGTYAFTNVSFGQRTYGYTTALPDGYTATHDATTGLEAITFAGPDIFSDNMKATSGDYLWSNAANWSDGVPVDGNTVQYTPLATGYDDLAALNLTGPNIIGGQVLVTGSSLNVGTVSAGVTTSGGTVYESVVAADAGSPVAVTVGTISGTGGNFGADGTGASFVGPTAADPGHTDYATENGGVVRLSATPADTSALEYTGGQGTVELDNPAATSSAQIFAPQPGDVLELPGTSVSNVTLGPTSFGVTTNAGSYDFTNVSYGNIPVTGYTAAPDPSTGLVAITFTGPDVFSANVKATSGPLSGDYLWSNAANWSNGVPVDGGVVQYSTPGATGYDDIAALNLADLDVNGGLLYVTGNSLSVVTMSAGVITSAGVTHPAEVTVDAVDAGSPVAVTVGTITGTGGIFFVDGAGASFVGPTAADPGANYLSEDGGVVRLPVTPAGTSELGYFGGQSTVELDDPAATSSIYVTTPAPGDVLELPGSMVSAVTFGPTVAERHSLSVTTDAGTYAFTNVQDGFPITGYTAAPDPATGLVAITFTGPDVFAEKVAATSGPLAGKYLWSNAANWSQGVPIDGSAVQYVLGAVGYDDLPALNLSELNPNGGDVYVTGRSLTVATLDGGDLRPQQPYIGTFTVDAADAGGPVTVTIDTITGTGSDYTATGAGADLVVESETDPGNAYYANKGGLVMFSTPPDTSSLLIYDYQSPQGQDTFALDDPSASTSSLLGNITPGDVLELPGSMVSAVSLGAPGPSETSLSVTTDTGTYAFRDVTYAAPVTGYTAAPDPSTGLVAITFTGPDVFSDNVKATSGPLTGDYLWSNAANWSQGVPIDGDSVNYAVSAVSVDDLAVLNLSALALSNEAEVYVVGGSLSVDSISATGVDGAAGGLLASADGLAPGTVTVGTFTTAGGKFGAFGTGSMAVAQSATDPGEYYFAANGGVTELSARPADTSYLDYYSEFEPVGATGTFALRNPGATNAALLVHVVPGDVLELPGTSVSAATFGISSLSVTTDAGSYAFSNVDYQTAVTGYTAAPDPSTGLMAITFTGVDTFSDNVKATSGPLTGDYLWSNAANWSEGEPINGDDVVLTTGAASYDDIPALTLASLTMNYGAVNVTGHSLTVDTVAGGGQFNPAQFSFLTADAVDAGAPVTVTVGTVTGTRGSYVASGSGATFVDQSATDPGNTYFAQNGGVFSLAATPDSTSDFYWFVGDSNTIELEHPAASVGADFNDYAPGDVLELPGTSVSNVSFGQNSLGVTTDVGTYTFFILNEAAGAVTGYTAAPDPTTGLVAITFIRLDTFEANVKATSRPFSGDYLWGNAANWSRGVPPVDGDSVTSAVSGYDDLNGLTLTALSQAAASFTEIVTELTVGSVINDGVLRVDDQGVLKITGSLTGNGILRADPSTIELDGPVSADQTVDLVGSGNTLILGDPQDFKGTIDGFTAGDVIDLENFSSSDIISKSFVDNILTLVESGGSIALAFANSPDPSIADFAVVPGTGTTITAPSAPCFAAGTCINTPGGDVPVEDLAIGDLVQTEFTGTAPIRWVGHRHIDCRRHPKPERVWPVRIAAGAFGSNMPHRDLWLSPDHAVHVQGVLIPIKRLINGTSIMQMRVAEVTYYHIELPQHDVLLAEGLPAESFLDIRDGSNYANRHGPIRLYPDYSARMWEAFGCAPLIVTGPELVAARALVGRFAGVQAAV